MPGIPSQRLPTQFPDCVVNTDSPAYTDFSKGSGDPAGLIASRTCRRSTQVSPAAVIVLDHQRDPVISRSLDELLAEAEFVIEPVTEHHARLARQVYADFGRGSGDRAGLNFGDCYGTSTRHQLVVCGDPDFIRRVGGPDVAHRLNLPPP